MSEQQNLDTMPLHELKALAFAEAEKDAAKAAEDAKQAADAAGSQKDRTRDAQGRFVKEDGSVDEDQAETAEEKSAREADEAAEAARIAEAEKNKAPEEVIISRHIDLGDGSGIQVFKGRGANKTEALEDLNDKLFESQVNATKKIREQQAELAKGKQVSEDDEYVVGEKLKKTPKQTIQEIVAAQLKAERQFNIQQDRLCNDFISSHPDYIASAEADNGGRIKQWVESHGYNEFTEDNLEKAYQDLKKSGLLKLKTTDASGTTDADAAERQRIADEVAKAAQSRSQKKSSSISTRGGAPVIKTEPSEDELYDSTKFSLEEIKRRANEQLAKANQS